MEDQDVEVVMDEEVVMELVVQEALDKVPEW